MPSVLHMVSVPAVREHISAAGTAKSRASHDRCARGLNSHYGLGRIFQDDYWVAAAHTSWLAAECGRNNRAPRRSLASRSCPYVLAGVRRVHFSRLRRRYDQKAARAALIYPDSSALLKFPLSRA
jgi:hypothetical protein